MDLYTLQAIERVAKVKGHWFLGKPCMWQLPKCMLGMLILLVHDSSIKREWII